VERAWSWNIAHIDDVFISHIHGDHCDSAKIQQIVAKFPDVRITAPTEVVTLLRQQGVTQAADIVPEGTIAFASPHEEVQPFGTMVPEELGVHFLGVYTHPGDCHHFMQSMPVLALPVVAPWGSTRRALELALELKPTYILPVHDWFLTPEAREWTYEGMAKVLARSGESSCSVPVSPRKHPTVILSEVERSPRSSSLTSFPGGSSRTARLQ
jgi:L-ascorbate metabolism protein UlaG (beta-lactamase superfamily)